MHVDPFFHHAHAALHDDFMFVIVLMERSVPARFYLELSHGEVWGLIVAADQDAESDPSAPGMVTGCHSSVSICLIIGRIIS